MVTLDLKRLDQKNSIELSIDKLTNFDAEIAVIGCLLWVTELKIISVHITIC